MLSKRNKTSFKPGHVRSPESIEKQRQTLKAKGTRPTNTWTEESRAKLSATLRRKALGHRWKTSHPYWLIVTEDGPRYEHRIIMENLIGRSLLRTEHVHHINKDTLDNRPENLELLTVTAHNTHHHTGHSPWNKGRSMLDGHWSRKHDACLDCSTTASPHVARGLCHPCYEKRRRNGQL